MHLHRWTPWLTIYSAYFLAQYEHHYCRKCKVRQERAL